METNQKLQLPCAEAALPLAGRRRVVLVVDERPQVVQAMEALLIDAGFFVLCARSPAEALDLAKAVRVDLLVFHFRDEGSDLLQQIRARHPVIGIMLGGAGTAADDDHWRTWGYSQRLVNPPSLAAVVETIRHHLPAAASAPLPAMVD